MGLRVALGSSRTKSAVAVTVLVALGPICAVLFRPGAIPIGSGVRFRPIYTRIASSEPMPQ